MGAGEKKVSAGEIGGLGGGLDESLGKFCGLLESIVIVGFDYLLEASAASCACRDKDGRVSSARRGRTGRRIGWNILG